MNKSQNKNIQMNKQDTRDQRAFSRINDFLLDNQRKPFSSTQSSSTQNLNWSQLERNAWTIYFADFVVNLEQKQNIQIFGNSYRSCRWWILMRKERIVYLLNTFEQSTCEATHKQEYGLCRRKPRNDFKIQQNSILVNVEGLLHEFRHFRTGK